MRHPSLEQRLDARRRPAGRAPVMYQKWRELLFLHWEFDPLEIRKTLPPGLEVDTFEGRAFLGVVPFFMRRIRPRFCPCIPGVSDFLEMNLRTYVFDEKGIPGVWFYSLDANQWLAVRVARKAFHLPYFDARMSATPPRVDDAIDYRCRRRVSADGPESRFVYRRTNQLPAARPETLEFFLVERYVLFAYDALRRRLYSGTVHHDPYPLSEVELGSFDDHVIELAGFDRPSCSPYHTIASPGVDVEVYRLEG